MTLRRVQTDSTDATSSADSPDTYIDVLSIVDHLRIVGPVPTCARPTSESGGKLAM